MLSTTAKASYTETEAAAELGVSVDGLRSLIRELIVAQDEDSRNAPMETFQPSDVLLLKLLASQPTALQTYRG